MRRLAYSSPFVPPEWIAAHGLSPARIMPTADRASSLPVPEGACPYMCAFGRVARSFPDVVGMIVTTTCDQMRRGSEWMAVDPGPPVFLLNVPATWQAAASRGRYRSELWRLGDFLVRCGGRRPSDEQLAETMLQFEEARAALCAQRDRVGPRGFAEALAAFQWQGEALSADAPKTPGVLGKPVALVGGPLLRDHLVLFDIVERSGGWVALDGTETGERVLPARFGRPRLRADPLAELAEAYFGAIPDAFRRPNTQLYEWLAREIAARAIRAVILVRHSWCDIWHAEAGRLREWLPVPLADLPLDETGATATASTRIGALLETLQ